jgi:hypothetical protein
MTASYSATEEEALRREVADGQSPICPRCGEIMIRTLIPPRPDVAYVRTRSLLQCTPCDLRCVVDEK